MPSQPLAAANQIDVDKGGQRRPVPAFARRRGGVPASPAWPLDRKAAGCRAVLISGSESTVIVQGKGRVDRIRNTPWPWYRPWRRPGWGAAGITRLAATPMEP